VVTTVFLKTYFILSTSMICTATSNCLKNKKNNITLFPCQMYHKSYIIHSEWLRSLFLSASVNFTCTTDLNTDIYKCNLTITLLITILGQWQIIYLLFFWWLKRNYLPLDNQNRLHFFPKRNCTNYLGKIQGCFHEYFL